MLISENSSHKICRKAQKGQKKEMLQGGGGRRQEEGDELPQHPDTTAQESRSLQGCTIPATSTSLVVPQHFWDTTLLESCCTQNFFPHELLKALKVLALFTLAHSELLRVSH